MSSTEQERETHSELARAAERNRVLLEVNNAIVTYLDRDELVHAICEAVKRVVPFDRVALTLYEADTNTLRMASFEGTFLSDYFHVGYDYDLYNSNIGWAFRHQRYLVRRDLEAEQEYPAERVAVTEGILSVCSIPIIVRGRSIAAMNVASRVRNQYSDEDAEFLMEVGKQIGIAIENMKAYEEITAANARAVAEVEQRRRAEETLRFVLEGTSSVTGKDFFRSMVRCLASALQARYAFVTECTGEAKERVRMLAFWKGEGYGENLEYVLAGTPCEGVVRGGESCLYARDLQRLFPRDTALAEWGAEGFLGVPVTDNAGEVIGHLAVLDDKPIEDDRQAAPVLRIFAARAGAELLRMRADADLRAALAEVEKLKNRLQAENIYLQDEIRKEHNFDEMVGNSPALLAVLQKIEQVAPTDATVLIQGETGTGKELAARAIHDRSARKGRPLVKVNCGAIPSGLVESELFGHVKGAFTGALESYLGRFALADGGTLFLDEVSELPLETQVKLLRVLQEQEFEPVGSGKTVRVNVRIIAATNRKLEEAVAEGRFRADLFYRLNVFPLELPPLRERRPDIPQLAMFFLERLSRRFGKKITAIPKETLDLLSQYSWPGNIRELQNIIERAVVLTQGPTLQLDRNLLPAVGDAPYPPGTTGPTRMAPRAPVETPTAAPPVPLGSLEEMERAHILNALRHSRGVIEGPRGAAQILNLHPNTLRSRMAKLGISRKSYEASL